MKREPQNDLRYIKTEKLIKETFRDMFHEMDYTQITIKKLTDRAMINRKTFYLHYSSMDELLGKLQAEIYSPLLKSTLEVELPKNLEKLVRELFQFCAQLDIISEKILCSQGNFPVGQSPKDYVLKSLFHYSQPNDRSSDCDMVKNNIIESYLNGSITFVYSQWVADERKLPLETLIKLTTQLIAKGIDTLCQPE